MIEIQFLPLKVGVKFIYQEIQDGGDSKSNITNYSLIIHTKINMKIRTKNQQVLKTEPTKF